MYHDFRSTSREEWTYAYLGSELLAASRTKWAYYKSEETKKRAEMATALNDPKLRINGEGMKDLERAILNNAELREQCLVFMHEFQRNGEKEHHLSLGDVVFFDLAKEPA